MWLSCSRSAECGQSCSGSRCSQDRLQCADTCLQAELQRLQAVAAAARKRGEQLAALSGGSPVASSAAVATLSAAAVLARHLHTLQ